MIFGLMKSPIKKRELDQGNYARYGIGKFWKYSQRRI
jgi:hypothetical protein